MPVCAQLHARPLYRHPPFRQGIPGIYSRGLVDPRVGLTVPGIESRIVQPYTDYVIPVPVFCLTVINDETKQYLKY